MPKQETIILSVVELDKKEFVQKRSEKKNTREHSKLTTPNFILGLVSQSAEKKTHQPKSGRNDIFLAH